MKGVGAKKFGMSLETQGIKLFWRDIPGFCRDIPKAPEKCEKKIFGFNFWPLANAGGRRKWRTSSFRRVSLTMQQVRSVSGGCKEEFSGINKLQNFELLHCS